jgi:hypothetical protein
VCGAHWGPHTWRGALPNNALQLTAYSLRCAALRSGFRQQLKAGDILKHPNQARYSGQRIFVVNIDDYAYLVPFVEGEGEVFLKTIIPSRKATNIYLRRRREDG